MPFPLSFHHCSKTKSTFIVILVPNHRSYIQHVLCLLLHALIVQVCVDQPSMLFHLSHLSSHLHRVLCLLFYDFNWPHFSLTSWLRFSLKDWVHDSGSYAIRFHLKCSWSFFPCVPLQGYPFYFAYLKNYPCCAFPTHDLETFLGFFLFVYLFSFRLFNYNNKL